MRAAIDGECIAHPGCGTEGVYTRGCRGEECREAATAERRLRRVARRATGQVASARGKSSWLDCSDAIDEIATILTYGGGAR